MLGGGHADHQLAGIGVHLIDILSIEFLCVGALSLYGNGTEVEQLNCKLASTWLAWPSVGDLHRISPAGLSVELFR